MRSDLPVGARQLATAAVAGLGLAAILAGNVGAGAESPALKGVTYANTALAGSALLYFVYLWVRADPVGRVATALAAGGALGILLALGFGALGAPAASGGLFECTALLSAAAVLAYLAMERAYGDRSAGVVVMSAVMASIVCEMWLITKGHAAGGSPLGGLSGYWAEGHRFAFSLGYLALAAAALPGLVAPPGRHLTQATGRRMVHGTLAVGVPLLVLGAGMGGVWCIVERGATPAAAIQVAVSWLTAGFVLAAWIRMGDSDESRQSRCAARMFAMATAGLLLPLLFGAALA